MQDRDLDALRNLYSHSSILRAIGSDADEFFDAETFLPILEIQLEEMPISELSVTHIEAFEFGDFAWGALAGDTSFGNGPNTPMRFSGARGTSKVGAWCSAAWIRCS